jgi:hypothetical protein
VRIRDVPSHIKEARREVRHWPDRDAALQMLDVLERVYEGEPDVFTKRALLLEMTDSEELGERVVELLT